ncbi:MAG: hypothetical protein ASARMPRED_002115 [Alectoria sarmentosa]|nr:MAG: hypothetical protein ASARMPRED_002115 [Alectoria sarmentosa]
MPSADPPSSSFPPPKPISISFGASKPKGPPAPAPRKRPHSALADNSDGEDEGQPVAELVSGFDQSGALVTNGKKGEKALLIIQAEKNRDWREESRRKRQKNLLPAEVQAARSGIYQDLKSAQLERDEVSKQSGISFVQRDQVSDTTVAEGQASKATPDQTPKSTKTTDEEAMEALLGGEKKTILVLPALEDERDSYKSEQDAYEDYLDEDDRFKADVASRPDVSTLDEYEVTPVHDFGAGLLRGMGWKDGEPVGKRRTQGTTVSKPRIVERRPALLGIGAKEVPTGVGDDELGAWGKGAKGKRKTDLTYNPVILKNSITGEMLTEEELEKKKRMATAWPGIAHPDGKGAGRRSENEGIGAGRMSKLAMALHDSAQDRGIEAVIMAPREGNEALTSRQGETEADLMSADIGAIDIFLLWISRDEARHMDILVDIMQ